MKVLFFFFNFYCPKITQSGTQLETRVLNHIAFFESQSHSNREAELQEISNEIQKLIDQGSPWKVGLKSGLFILCILYQKQASLQDSESRAATSIDVKSRLEILARRVVKVINNSTLNEENMDIQFVDDRERLG